MHGAPPSATCRATTSADPATFGLFRMYNTSLDLCTGAPEVGVFTTLEEAVEWVAQ